jgi:hypothetical protein
MANFAFALKRALLHLRREIGKETFTLGDKLFFAGNYLGRLFTLEVLPNFPSPPPPFPGLLES